MENNGTNAEIVKAIRSDEMAKPGQHCVCWNDSWENVFVIGTVRKITMVRTVGYMKMAFEVQSALTGNMLECDNAVVFNGPMPKDDDEKTDESTTV